MIRLYCLLVLILGLQPGLSFFVSQQPPKPSLHRLLPHQTSLLAKKPRKNSPKKKTTSAGGFGVDKQKDSFQGKVRSVSGHAPGAGSKPLRKSANTFDAIRKEHGVEACNDVYLKSPLNSPTTYWFVGKVARDLSTSATPTEAVLSQKRIILEYAKQQLRPQNFGGKYAASLEVWLAPGDSEMSVVQNKLSLEKVEGSASDLSSDFDVDHVGFNPEIYVGDEVTKGGLRVELDEEGRPTKPAFEVNQSA